MSVTFYGKKASGEAIMLGMDDRGYLNLANGNAVALLELLRLDPGKWASGEASVPEVRRGIMYARGTFERRAGDHVRPASDTRRPGRARMIIMGIDEDYLRRRVDDFETFVNEVVARGATIVYWA